MNRLIHIYFCIIAVSNIYCETITIENENNIEQRFIRSESDYKEIYLLVSTSSKIYCMKMPKNSAQSSENDGYFEDTNNYEIIYEEHKQSHNWITDAFYVKSEDLIYVNVYNSTSSSSNIFTLSFDKTKNVWVKNMLYRDQSYCLGIAYNEKQKEIYWTASKSIIAGSSVVPNRYRILFNLDAAKKLLYLKYDNVTDNIFVSTLNYVYACSLKKSEREPCRIIARDLVSARGLYLDSANRNLFVVDHKKKKINKIKLNIDQTDESESSTSTLLSSETMPDIGDIFYMCIYNRTNTLIWSEFSGKIKASNLNDMSTYKLLFSTNEYTYSISLMDNSTDFIQTSTTKRIVPSTTIQFTSTRIIRTTKPVLTTDYIETVTTKPIRRVTTKSIVITTKIFKPTTTTTTVSSTTIVSTSPVTTTETTTTTSSTATSTSSSTTVVSTTTMEENEFVNNSIDKSLVFKTIENEKTNLFEQLKINEENIKITKEIQRGIATKSLDEMIRHQPKNVLIKAFEEDDENLEIPDPDINLKKQSQKSLKSSHVNELSNNFEKSNQNKTFESLIKTTDATKVSYNYLRSSQLNIALYIVICLLCFSLIINIILLYVSKIRYSKNICNNKLIISHEIRNKSETMPSQRSSTTSKTSNDDEIADCNINLISSNDCATSAIDSDNNSRNHY